MFAPDIATFVIAFIFAYLYANEKQYLALKWVWLFVAIMAIAYGSTQNYQLAQTTYTATTGITTYTYTATNYLIPFTYGIGILLIGLIAYFVKIIIDAVRREI